MKTWSFTAVDFSPDGGTLAACGFGEGGPSLFAWDVKGGKQRFKVEAPAGAWSLQYTPDGNRILCAGLSDNLWSFDPRNGDRNKLPGGLAGRQAAVVDKGKQLMTISALPPLEDLRLWDLATGQLLTTIQEHISPIDCLAATAGGRWAASGSRDGEICIWDVNRARISPRKFTWPGHIQQVISVAWAADGNRAATRGADYTYCGWDTTGGFGRRCWLTMNKKRPAHFDPCPTFPVTQAIALSPDGKMIATPYVGRSTVCLCDVRSGTPLSALLVGHQVSPTCLLFAPGGAVLATGDDEGVVFLWGTSAKQRLQQTERSSRRLEVQTSGPPAPNKPPRKSAVAFLAFGPDGKTLVVAYSEPLIGFWDVKTGTHRRTLAYRADALAYTGDGQTLLTATLEDRAVVVRSFAVEGEERQVGIPVQQHCIPVQRVEPGTRSCFALSPDSATFAVAAGETGLIHWVEMATGRTIVALQGHEAAVRSLAFSPDGTRLLSGSRDTTALIWNTLEVWRQSGQPPTNWNQEMVRRYWETLADADPAKAYPALAVLAAAPDCIVPFLKMQVQPATAKPTKSIAQLLKDMDEDSTEIRKQAMAELIQYGPPVLKPVRAARETASPQTARNLRQVVGEVLRRKSIHSVAGAYRQCGSS